MMKRTFLIIQKKKFSLAWWLFVDTYLWDTNKNKDEGDMKSIISYIPGILGTVGFFL